MNKTVPQSRNCLNTWWRTDCGSANCGSQSRHNEHRLFNSSGYRCLRTGIHNFPLRVFWHRLAPKTETKFTSMLARIASDPRWCLSVIFATWLYMAVTGTLPGTWLNNQVVALRNDEQAIAKVLDRIVLPRHLNKQQQTTISGFLLQFEPHEFAFRLSS